MSKIIQPFGRMQWKIVVKADDKGLIVVETSELDPMTGRIRIGSMDSRHMVLALQRVVMDYSLVIFNNMGPVPPGGQQGNGEENNSNNGNQT